jgi:hypothetical protein
MDSQVQQKIELDHNLLQSFDNCRLRQMPALLHRNNTKESRKDFRDTIRPLAGKMVLRVFLCQSLIGSASRRNRGREA